MLTREEFDTLAAAAAEGTATTEELAALEPYRVRRAVIMAAGFGCRMVPVTLERPKPLVRVNGTRIIDTLLDALLAAGVDEIYVVRGYKAEEFDELLEKYPMLRFLYNPLYKETNAISSARCAADLLEDAYLCEADQIIRNPTIITPYQYSSNFLGVPVSATDDWCLTTEEDGVITGVRRGGTDCHRLYVVSYWTAEDGKKLGRDIRKAFDMPGGRDIFFESVPLNLFPENYRVRVRECSFGDIEEIDTFEELKAADSSYETYGTN